MSGAATDHAARQAAVKRAPVQCPKCGGTDIVAGEEYGFACDGCGHKARLKRFRQEAASKTPEG